MPSRKTRSPADNTDATRAYEHIFTREVVEEVEVDLEKLRRKLPSANDALNADLAGIHTMIRWNTEAYLREFFHLNPGMLKQVRSVIRHLKDTHNRVIALTELMPDKLGADSYVLEQCCRRDDTNIDPEKGIYPPRLMKMSEAFVTAGYIIPETKRLIKESPSDALDLTKEALQWGSEHHHQARPLDQTVTRYLIKKLLQEGYLHDPRPRIITSQQEFDHTKAMIGNAHATHRGPPEIRRFA